MGLAWHSVAAEGTSTWHMPARRAQPAEKVSWQPAESHCQDTAGCGPRGLSCHMPVSVPAAVERRWGAGWPARGRGGCHRGGGGERWCRLFLARGPAGLQSFPEGRSVRPQCLRARCGPSRHILPLFSPPEAHPWQEAVCDNSSRCYCCLCCPFSRGDAGAHAARAGLEPRTAACQALTFFGAQLRKETLGGVELLGRW